VRDEASVPLFEPEAHPFPALLGGMLLLDGDLVLSSSSGGTGSSAASRTVRRLFTLTSSWALAPVSLILRRPVCFCRAAAGGSSWRRCWRAPGSDRLKATPERRISAGQEAAPRHVYVFQREYATVDPARVEVRGVALSRLDQVGLGNS